MECKTYGLKDIVPYVLQQFPSGHGSYCESEKVVVMGFILEAWNISSKILNIAYEDLQNGNMVSKFHLAYGQITLSDPKVIAAIETFFKQQLHLTEINIQLYTPNNFNKINYSTYPLKEIDDSTQINYAITVQCYASTMQRLPAKIDEQIQNIKDAALFEAVYQGIKYKIANHLNNGANVNAKGPFDRTPVYFVLRDAEIITQLKDNGANLNVVDEEGISPIDLAYGWDPKGKKCFVKKLESYGALKTSQLS